MNREALQQNPLPIDRVARRVTRPARSEDVWLPKPGVAGHTKFSGTVLRVAPIPSSAWRSRPALRDIVGRRRDRMQVIGYAAEQGTGTNNARWVVRCDCGNYEHRTRVLRWVETQAPDSCLECRDRTYRMRGEWADRAPATRPTALRHVHAGEPNESTYT